MSFITLDHVEFIRVMAFKAEEEGNLPLARHLLEQCLDMCQCGIQQTQHIAWIQLFRDISINLGILLKTIAPKDSLSIWRNIGRRLDDRDPLKFIALKEQLEILCQLKEWHQAQKLAETAQQIACDSVESHSTNEMFWELVDEVKAYAMMANSNVAKPRTKTKEVDFDFLPPEALQCQKEAKARTHKTQQIKEEKKKKKVKVKEIRRRGYEEVEALPKALDTTKTLTEHQKLDGVTKSASSPCQTPSKQPTQVSGPQTSNISSAGKRKKKRNQAVNASKEENTKTQQDKMTNNNQGETPVKAMNINVNARCTFPLAKTHHFMLGCQLCSEETKSNGKWQVRDSHPGCIENRLFVRFKNSSQSLWTRIRRRQSKICTKSYAPCRNFPEKPCARDRETCWFAHSKEEIKIWNAEKFEGFSIEAFIAQNKGQRERIKGKIRSVQLNPKQRSIPDCLAMFCKTYQGDFQLVANVLFYKSNGIDIRIPKPKDSSNQKTELCREEFCLKDTCRLSHTEVERDFWLLAAETNMTFEALCKRLSKKSENNSSIKPNIPSMNGKQLHKYYCSLCCKQCNSMRQFDYHCNSKPHTDKFTAEDGDQWQHRQPPPGWQLMLCNRNIMRSCQYSNAPDQFNLCIEAHSEEELEEWKQRIEIRRQKMRFAKQKGLLSYIARLQTQLDESKNVNQLMKTKLKNITIESKQELQRVLNDKKDEYEWQFEIFTKKHTLQNAALLHDKDRFWFHLKHLERKNVQYLDDEDLKSHMAACCQQEGNSYQITVRFIGGAYGSFRQWLVLDFGKSHLLVRRLQVDVGQKIHAEMQHLRQSLQTDNWQKVTVVPFDNDNITRTPPNKFKQNLHNKYKLRPGDVSSSAISNALKKDNYKTKMHDLLYMEETYQLQMISRFTSKLMVKISRLATMPNDTMSQAPVGYRFAKIMMNRIFASEGNAGYLVQRSCDKVLLRPKEDDEKTSRIAYEAPFVTKTSIFGVNGMGHDYVFVCVSEDFLKAANVTDEETEIEVLVQFQMNRSYFCAMHFALDEISANLDILFPMSSQNFDHMEYTLKTDKLNTQQLKALNQILHHRKGDPMLILYGAFGTGKTMTLSHTALQLMKSEAIDKRSKILICTLSNSAADLILNQLDELNRGEDDEKVAILRVYQEHRRFNTISPNVMKYVLTEIDPLGNQTLKMPSVSDIKNANFVITTVETCLELVRLKVRGMFSHIFIDEAGQTLEPQLLMPLSLANKDTCIVLAGDVKQMSPKVYSPHAKELSTSLLERIFQTYRMEQNFKGNQEEPAHTVTLRENYRNDWLILRFLSMVNYGKEDWLIWRSGIQTSQPSLRLHMVQGEEKAGSGTSFYNEAEVQEIGDLLSELKKNWPEEWEKLDLSKIAVTSAYADQVDLIRRHLRSLRMSAVTVLPMESMQGWQYDVVVISTVHTASSTYPTSSDLGYLSDMKLVNTAISRAKYCVIVVGDAEALCTRGSNMLMWYTYLNLAMTKNGLVVQDPGHFFAYIEERMSKTYHAQQDAKDLMTTAKVRESVEKMVANDVPSIRSEVASIKSTVSSMKSEAASTGSEVASEDSWNNCSEGDDDDSFESCEDDADEDNIEVEMTEEQFATLPTYDADEIPNALKEGEDHLLLSMFDEQFIPHNELEHLTHFRILRNISYDQSQGRAKLDLNPHNKTGEKRKTNWMPLIIEHQRRAEHAELDEDDPTGDIEDTVAIDEHDIREIAEMERLLLTQRQYKRCHLHIISHMKIFAVILDDPEMKGKTVMIKNRRHCGRALDGDEVVLELKTSFDGEPVLPFCGKVLGITRRNMKMRYRKIVCRVDPTNSSLMLPLAKKLPPMVNLQAKREAKKGHILLHTMDKKKKFINSYNVKVEDPLSKLYSVMFLKWDNNNSLPLGMVIEILPAGEDLETGQHILSLCHNVPKHISDTSELHQICKLRFPQNYMEGMVFPDRLDLRDKRIFTIDDASSQDLDDALHIDENSDGTFTVGVHIADVTHFVKHDSDIDKEAYKRGTSYYPANQPPIHMLPRYLGTDLCSLLPGKDRLTVSVLFTLSSGGRVKSVSRHLSIIRSRCRLDYKEVEDVLDNIESTDSELKEDLQKLHALAEVFAKQRKGAKGFLAIEDDEGVPKARMLIEEWMVKTNKHIAEHLLAKFPDRVPLRKQMAPTPEELEEWTHKYGNHIPSSFCLQRIANLLQQPTAASAHDGFIQIYSHIWQELVEQHNEYEKLNKIARSVHSFPEQLCALKSWHGIQSRAIYHCSGLGTDHLHFSLASRAYTHFTSPIRRYIDIVAHRLLKADIKNEPPQYSTAEVAQICIHCTGAQMQANDYEGETKLLSTACDLKESPNDIHVLVKDIDHRQIEMIFPAYRYMPHNLRKVPYSNLHLKEDPHVQNSKATLTFKKRIYHIGESRAYPGNGAYLDPKQYTVAIPSNLWRLLVDAMAVDDEELSIGIFSRIKTQVATNYNSRYTSEVSSESAVHNKESQHITFQRQIESGDVLRVQLATKVDRGIIKPCMQLIKLTPSFHICLEHARDPVMSFSTEKLSRYQGLSIIEYQRHWLTLLSMESAYSVIKSPGEQAHVHNVPAEWKRCNDGVVHGRMKMAREFCEKRFLLFSLDVLFGSKDDTNDGGNNWVKTTHVEVQGDHCENWKVTQFGFLCVKFTFTTKAAKSMTWVGHCHITKVLIDEKDVILILKLNQSSYDFPEEALDKKSYATPPCSIHWLDKPTPDVRTESAVLGLSECDPESLSVLLSLREIVPSTDCSEPVNIRINTPVLKAANEDQAIALKTALQTNNKFVLIWGPPGTGKSMTGVKLAFLFAKSNQQGEQVIYTGPSNKSVNVVTAKLKQLDIKVIRIFGEKLVQRYYPLPNFPQSNALDDETVEEHRDVALHELIRLPNRLHAEEIQEFDRKFHNYPKDITLTDINKYKKLLAAASLQELEKAEVILCTCSSSGHGLYKEAFQKQIKQVIVDECGMCKEPETLIPLVACNPQKVVLIGDHRQLRPVINCNLAKNKGLDKTLFEEYSRYAVMLREQYRMHKMIQEFPSQQFYGGLLRCGLPEEQNKATRPYNNFWPAGPKTPIAFCHIEGEEALQSVTTDIAGKNSACNMAEVNHVLKVVDALVTRGHIDPEKIVILTPYRSQLGKIKEKLCEHSLDKVTASTIITSQGSEWPYVILSTVRSLPRNEIEEKPWPSWSLEKLGFLTDPHQVNVALTRAKNGLIIIGNGNLLRCDEIWSNLLDFYREHGALTDWLSFP